jgi:hypothetical protein
MKKVVSISLGAAEADYSFRTRFLGESFSSRASERTAIRRTRRANAGGMARPG